MTKAQIAEAFRRWQAQNPTPRTELQFHNNFQLLMAVMLSAQSTDKSVNRATAKLFAVAPDPEKMLALGLDNLKEYIKTIGLYNNKAVNMLKTCQLLLEKFNGQVPNRREDLESLPGVGRKTANVILNTAFGQPTMAVDTHIFRLANRTGLAPGKTVNAVEKQLLKRVPPPYLQYGHNWLVLHGRYVCQARRPRCGECIIRDLCVSGRQRSALDSKGEI